MTPERYLRIKQLFQQACELAGQERAVFLDREAGGDRELRLQIEKMLRQATGAGWLDHPAWEGIAVEKPMSRGDRLGPYEILAPAGQGGMGRVYKALDTRLDRLVAIKVLSAEYSHRLRAEARAISSLNHPHVCALYDIGDQDGAAYLVMEFVEGESLAALLAKKRPPLDDALRYAAEIAGALAAAHAYGIVHRDLKPDNIMIAVSGVKVLDFGVAQMAHQQECDGAIVGTAAYMSPSQLNGNPADARSDIYALGLVLYEMATGARYAPENGNKLAHLPAGVASLIERCLKQDAAARIQRMEEVQASLQQLRALPVPAARRIRGRRAFAGAGILAALAGLAIRQLEWQPVPLPPPPRTVAAQPPPTETKRKIPPPVAAPLGPPVLTTLAAYPGLERDPSFSPDGSKLAFAWHSNGRSGYGIYIRPVASSDPPTRLTEGGSEDWGPAWSPDGRTIAFRRRSAQSGIYTVGIHGGEATLIGAIGSQAQETLPQLSWSHDGRYIAAPDRMAGEATRLYLFSVATGDKWAITSNLIGTAHAPAFSPDGKSLAYASCQNGASKCGVFLMEFGRNLTPVRGRRITEEGEYIRGIAWLPGGRSLVYAAGPAMAADTYLYRVNVNPPGLPQRIELAGKHARHPAISRTGGLLAYTQLSNWHLQMIQNFAH